MWNRNILENVYDRILGGGGGMVTLGGPYVVSSWYLWQLFGLFKFLWFFCTSCSLVDFLLIKVVANNGSFLCFLHVELELL